MGSSSSPKGLCSGALATNWRRVYSSKMEGLERVRWRHLGEFSEQHTLDPCATTHASAGPTQSGQAVLTARASSTRTPAPTSQSVFFSSETRPAHAQKHLAHSRLTSMSKSLSIFTASPNREMYCVRFANCHMFRSFFSVLGVSICSSTSISLAARLRAGIVVERAVGDACKRRVSGAEGGDERSRGIVDGVENMLIRRNGPWMGSAAMW